MANSYYDPLTFIPYTLIKSEDFNTSETRTEAAFDLLPEPITTGDKGFEENFKIKTAPVNGEEVVRLDDLKNGSFDYKESTLSGNNTYYIDDTDIPTNIPDGYHLYVKIPSDGTNTGTSYININNNDIKEIVDWGGNSLTGGEITADYIIHIVRLPSDKWQLLSNTSTVAPEAPEDGKAYVRKNGVWAESNASDVVYNSSDVATELSSQASDISNLQSSKMDKSGGLFTGAPQWDSDPTDDNDLTRKSYVDDQDTNLQNQINANDTDISNLQSDVSNLQSSKMDKSGGVFTGAPQWDSDPSDNNDLTRKSYVDIKVSEAHEFDSGTRMIFHQDSPPSGWSLVDLGDTALLRVSTYSDKTLQGTHNPIIMDVVPAHTHPIYDPGHYHRFHDATVAINRSDSPALNLSGTASNNVIDTTSNAVTNISIQNNTNASNWEPRYTDIIICEKD